MTREEMTELRARLILGEPPYTKDELGNLVRKTGGTPGLHERQRLGDHDPNASGVRMAMETELLLIDHLLERMR